jgi:hypothetical protein
MNESVKFVEPGLEHTSHRKILRMAIIPCPWVLRHIIGQELQGDEMTKFNILSFVDDTAAAQLLDQAVGDSLTDQVRRSAHWRESYAAVLGGSNGSVDQRQ